MLAYSQRDPRWAADVLGTGEITIGAAGCLLTCAAGLLAEAGVGTDPGRLNRWLTANGGYVDDNLFVFQSIAAFGVTLADLVFCPRVAAPVAALAEHLANGAGVIVEVDFTPGGAVQPHWVRLLDVRSGAILDPWQAPGQEAVNLSAYSAPGWDAARALLAAAVYVPTTARVVYQSGAPVGPAQPALCLLE